MTALFVLPDRTVFIPDPLLTSNTLIVPFAPGQRRMEVLLLVILRLLSRMLQLVARTDGK